MPQVPLRVASSPFQIHGLEQGGTPASRQLPRQNLTIACSSSPLAHQPLLLVYCLGPRWSLINGAFEPETSEGYGLMTICIPSGTRGDPGMLMGRMGLQEAHFCTPQGSALPPVTNSSPKLEHEDSC